MDKIIKTLNDHADDFRADYALTPEQIALQEHVAKLGDMTEDDWKKLYKKFLDKLESTKKSKVNGARPPLSMRAKKYKN